MKRCLSIFVISLLLSDLSGLVITMRNKTYRDAQITQALFTKYLKRSTKELKKMSERDQAFKIKQVARLIQVRGLAADVGLVYLFLKETMRLMNYNNKQYVDAMHDLLVALKKNVDIPLVNALKKAESLPYGLIRSACIENVERIYARLQISDGTIVIGRKGYLLREITAPRFKTLLFESIAQMPTLTPEERGDRVALVTKIIETMGIRWEGIRPWQNVVELYLFLEKVIELADKNKPKERAVISRLFDVLAQNRLVMPVKTGKPKRLEPGAASLKIGLRKLVKQIGYPRYYEYKGNVEKWRREWQRE